MVILVQNSMLDIVKNETAGRGNRNSTMNRFSSETAANSEDLSKSERIWQVVSQIPRGKVASYGQVAKLAQLPGYARYVGYVMKHLPEDTRLPWYRVVNAQGKLSFPRDSNHYQRQKSKLENEGIVFINGRFSLRKYGWNQDSGAEEITNSRAKTRQ